jgi:hypothetical protein
MRRHDVMPPGGPPPLDPYETEAELVQACTRLWRFAVRNRHATIPLAVPLGMLAAGRILADRHAGLLTPGALSLAADVTMWFTADRKWDTTPRWHGWKWTSEVAYARATVIAGGAWLVLAGDIGPLHAGMEYMLAVLGVAWGVPYWAHKRPRGKRARRRHERLIASWNMWWQSHAPAWGAAGSGIIDVKARGGLESLLIQLWAGRQSAGTIKGVIPLLESALGGYVHHGMTRLEINKSNPSQVWLYLKREDPLREVIEWSPDMAPCDITERAPLGVRESGRWLRACLLTSWFLNGKTRTGKSNELSVMLATITGCSNARTLLIDMKGGRAARPWLPGLDWVATSTDEADLMLRFVMAEIKARSAYAYNGDEQLHPTDEVPALFLVIDETYEVTSEMSRSPGAGRRAGWLATIASQCQGLAIYVIVLTQYGALAESVGTEQTRSNLPGRMCFQTEKREHGAFALGDDAQGAVDTTKLAEKGQFFYRANSQTTLEQVRGPHISHDMAREIAARNAARTGLHARPLTVYASDWQDVYDRRWERLPQAFLADAPQAAHIAPSPALRGPASSKINMGVPVPTPDDIDAQIAAINAEVDETPGTDADVRRAAALRDARGEPPIDLASETSKRQRRFAGLVQAASPEYPVSPTDLRRGTGLSESWIYLTLARLAEAGAVDKLARGRYAPVPGADVGAALDAIQREGGRLAAAARDLVDAASR